MANRLVLDRTFAACAHPIRRQIIERLAAEDRSAGPFSLVTAASRAVSHPRSEPMPVDVSTDIVIARPRAEVAAYACDPDNATAWYENIEAVDWRTPPPLAVGSRLAFVARFLGRRLEYTYEVREHVPGERFVMSTSEGPFPMETTYAFADAGDGATRMELRNRGEPAGFAKAAAPLMAPAMRRANGKDLRRLKDILERSAPR